jgi:hypothetical protein
MNKQFHYSRLSRLHSLHAMLHAESRYWYLVTWTPLFSLAGVNLVGASVQ